MAKNSKKVVLLTAVLFLLLGLPLRGKEKRGFGFSLRLSGSLIDIRDDEALDGALGMNNFWADMARSSGWTVVGYQGDVPGKFTWDGDVELIIHFNRFIGLGIGGGYLWRSIPFELTMTKGAQGGGMDLMVKNSVIPLKASIYLKLPILRWVGLTLHGGASYYLARYASDFHLWDDTGWERIVTSSDASGFGFHGGAGLEFNINSSFHLYTEVQYRSVKIDGFEGHADYSDSDSFFERINGRLYSYDIEEGGHYYHIVNLEETAPSGSDANNVRESTLNFGGLTLTAGVRIRL